MPYYNCKHIPSVHCRFNNLLGDNLHSKKTLETLHSLYDYDIFNMNSFNANIDPDFNFLEPRLRSRYFSPHSFAETIKSKINQNHRNCISILHSNIRSLKRNFEQFHQHVLSELKVSFSVIGLTEIRIRDGACNENLPGLPNYYFEETICNPKEISNSLNTFFATVGHKLTSCILSSSPDHDFSTFLDPPIQSSFYFPLLPLQKSKVKSKCCQ